MLHGNESVEMDLRRLPITLSRRTQAPKWIPFCVARSVHHRFDLMERTALDAYFRINSKHPITLTRAYILKFGPPPIVINESIYGPCLRLIPFLLPYSRL